MIKPLKFEMVEVFNGALFTIFAKAIPDLNSAFRDFAIGLKRYMESRE